MQNHSTVIFKPMYNSSLPFASQVFEVVQQGFAEPLQTELFFIVLQSQVETQYTHANSYFCFHSFINPT
jgi:hypothetical protein